MKIKIISTFSDSGYNEYGKYFVESCKKFIDSSINVTLYVDNVTIQPSKNLSVLNLENSVPELVAFKTRNKSKFYKDFRWDAVRFAHKVYATVHASRESDLDYLIWLDADTEIYDIVNHSYLLKFLPKDKFVGYIGRNAASETGFLIFDMKHPEAKNFFDRYKWYYDSDKIYDLPECHDGFVFDVLRKEFEADNKISSHNLSPVEITKNHFNAIFDGYMLHFKGERKEKRDQQIAKALRRKQKR